MPHTAGAALYAVEALTPTNVWVAGRTYTAEPGVQPYVAHLNGSSWRRGGHPDHRRRRPAHGHRRAV
ncbi:MAG TPA: hypothetical protein VFT95_03110, partial [Micromonosporaceae bacterium]|nr:hypothetical protein [Micromonosporaceae bacterium]